MPRAVGRHKTKRPPPAAADITRERQVQQLGHPEPACVICGLAEPEELRRVDAHMVEFHHFAGRANSEEGDYLCLVHHAIVQASMRLHEDLLAQVEDRSPLEQMAAAQLGRAAFARVAAEQRQREGEWLLHLHRALTRRHGARWWRSLGVLPFPGRAQDGGKNE